MEDLITFCKTCGKWQESRVPMAPGTQCTCEEQALKARVEALENEMKALKEQTVSLKATLVEEATKQLEQRLIRKAQMRQPQ